MHLCAIQYDLDVYLFYVQQCVYVNVKLLIYPSPIQLSPWVTLNLFSMSVTDLNFLVCDLPSPPPSAHNLSCSSLLFAYLFGH